MINVTMQFFTFTIIVLDCADKAVMLTEHVRMGTCMVTIDIAVSEPQT